MKSLSAGQNQTPPAHSIPNVNCRRELKKIYRRLYRAFGPQHWWPGDSPLEVIIGAILTQNTAWTNVEKALANLKNAGLLDINRLITVPIMKLQRLIRPAGYYQVKTRRLRAVTNFIHQKGGIQELSKIPTATLRSELLHCYGIGLETADSILLYAFNRPVFVIDAYTRRILSRYGVIEGNEPYEWLRNCIENSLMPRPLHHPSATVLLFNEFHALLVKLAKTHCRVKPLCSSCPLERD